MLPRQGKFGPIQIVRRGGVQSLLLNGQVQGSCFLDPNTRATTPISSSPYTYGWMLAGVEIPIGTGLMIGLGSGTGAVQLLYNFVDFDLTVVEIDPVMIATAKEAFPLLDHFINLGRLNIIQDDAKHYCEACSTKFDIGFADAYDGSGGFALLTNYLPALQKCCHNVILNVIDGPMARHISSLIDVFKATSTPIKWGMRAVSPEAAQVTQPMANYILTTIDVNWQDADAFLPFADMTGFEADYAKECWSLMISNPIHLVEAKNG